MKIVITTVGTSLIEKYCLKNKLCGKEYLSKKVSQRDVDDDEDYQNLLVSWAKGKRPDKISAEIASLIRLEKEYGGEVEVYLLITDTIASHLCATVIKRYFEGSENGQIVVREIRAIEDLRIEKIDEFNIGKDNLIRVVSRIISTIEPETNEKKRRKIISSDVIFNITGGYKGVIPLMTILSQLYECELVYKFEESDALIQIPRIPVNFDPILTESLYLDLWFKRDKDSHNYKNTDKLKEYGFIDNRGNITALGRLFYKMVQKKQAAGKNVFGYFVEYKVFEYLYEKGEYRFKHSYEEFFPDKKPKGELDLVFKKSTGDLEVWEIKSAIDFTNINKAQTKVKQIKTQLKNYPHTNKYKLIVYSIEPNIFDIIKETVQVIMEDFKINYPKIEFSSDFLALDKMKISDQNKNANPYQALFKSSVKEENFKKIY